MNDLLSPFRKCKARSLELLITGGGEPRHDWAYLLGKMGLLEADQFLASLTRVMASASMLLFLGIGLYQVWLMITLPKRNSETPF